MMDPAELELFQRSIRQAAEYSPGPDLDARLVELGWLEALVAETRTAISVLFPLLGSSNTTASALDMVMAFALSGDPLSGAVVLPPLGAWSPPGRLSGRRLTVEGLATSALPHAGTTLVAANNGVDGRLIVAALDRSSLTIRSGSGVDPAYGLVEVAGEDLDWTEVGVAAGGWPLAVAYGQLALGYELAGCSRAMLELARRHANDRIQFGRPIGAFQAIRHRLAETLVAVEAADAVLHAASEDPSPQLAAAAKAIAGRGGRSAAGHCQQVLAGVGFTAEHPFHRYFRRVLLLDQLLGTSRALTEQLGAQLIEGGRLVAVPAL